MLLEELSRNKKGGAVIILVSLCLLYIISKKFLFHTILGRLLLVLGLITTTNYNKMLGVGLLIMICLAYSQMCNDFENMENPSSSTSKPTSMPAVPMPSVAVPSMPMPSMPSVTPSVPSEETTTKPSSTAPDTATIQAKIRNIVTGKQSSSLPVPPKNSTQDVSGSSSLKGLKESFLGFSEFY